MIGGERGQRRKVKKKRMRGDAEEGDEEREGSGEEMKKRRGRSGERENKKKDQWG